MYVSPLIKPALRCGGKPEAHTNGQYRLVKASASEPLPANAPYAHKFTSFALNAPEYIKHLAETAKSKGVRFIRRRLTSLDQAYALPEIGNVSLVINASGLGARSLGGVKDENVYGARGQTLLVHAPEVTRCIMRSDAFEAAKKVAGGKSQGKYRSLAIDTCHTTKCSCKRCPY